MTTSYKEKADEIREAAETDLEFFISLVAPHRVLGRLHTDLIQWWEREEASTHQLVLLPRAHQKSMLMAYRVAWEITRKPWITVLYISSTANLAEKQLKAVKDILDSKVYKLYWPEMLHEQEGKRESWAVGQISVDHPDRRNEGVRDPTVFTAGLTTNIVGMHCDVAVMDDVVTNDTAYTQEGRNKVQTAYSLLSSIENTDAREWIVGTRYHPRDLYQDLMDMEEDIYDDTGEQIGGYPVYEVYEKQVEDRGDGTGEFLWPRQRRDDGRWYGFDIKQLAKKRAQYLDKSQFRAQYYNNPNDPDTQRISSEKFQYYDRKFLNQESGHWAIKGTRINVVAAMDFAYSLRKKADYTAIVVLGIDHERNYYILDIARFKTDSVSRYFNELLTLYNKWGFRKLRAEVSVAQQVIVKSLKEMFYENGMSISVDEHRPNRHEGSKEERMAATLDPRYEDLKMYHYKGGMCQALEEELVVANPPHDDLKDALTSAIDVAVAPAGGNWARKAIKSNVTYHRFGGSQ
jgi:phage terminase large subunit-like protein